MSAKVLEEKFSQASALFKQGRHAEALIVLDALDAEQPLNKNVMFPRALCLAALGRAEEALQVCESLEALYQDKRAAELRARLEGRVQAAQPTGPHASAAPGPKKPPRTTGPRFQWSMSYLVAAAAVAGVLAVGYAAYYAYSQRAVSGDMQSAAQRERRPERESTGPSEQEQIDKAIRQRMQSSAEPPFSVLYDTGSPLAKTLSPEDISGRAGWAEVPEGATDHAFKGDAVVMNNQVALVLRKDAPSAELFGRTAGFEKPYAQLTPMGAAGAATALSGITVAACAQDEVVVEATYSTGAGGPLKVRYDLPMGQVCVKVTPVEGAAMLRIVAPCRFVVLPDFFADDIVVDARTAIATRAELPSENFLLHMVGDGEAIVMSLWNNREQDVQIAMSGDATGNQIQSSEVAFGKDGAVWVALLTGNGVWHMRDVKAEEKGKETPLAWKQPYPALWRVDWRRTDKLTDSWEMLTQNPDGSFKKHGLFEEEENSWTKEDWWGSGQRTRIASGLGRFHYPCWVDTQGQGWFQPLKAEAWGAYSPLEGTPEFQGPAIVYPLNRLVGTPLDKFTVVDLVRSSLGVGPCEYILDVEGQSEAFEGMPTCSVRDILDEIYEGHQQAERRAEVEKALDDVVAFITLIRGRIDKYQAFSKELQAYLNEYRQKGPDLGPYIDEMVTLTQRIDNAYAEHAEGIKTVEYAADLAKKFRKEVLDNTGADAAEKCKQYTEAWVGIGGNQDTLVAECRVAVKLLRQGPATALTDDPKRAELVHEVRARTENILRAPVNYEAPRH